MTLVVPSPLMPVGVLPAPICRGGHTVRHDPVHPVAGAMYKLAPPVVASMVIGVVLPSGTRDTTSTTFLAVLVLVAAWAPTAGIAASEPASAAMPMAAPIHA